MSLSANPDVRPISVVSPTTQDRREDTAVLRKDCGSGAFPRPARLSKIAVFVVAAFSWSLQWRLLSAVKSSHTFQSLCVFQSLQIPGEKLQKWRKMSLICGKVLCPPQGKPVYTFRRELNKDTSTQGLRGESLWLICSSQGRAPFPRFCHENLVL